MKMKRIRRRMDLQAKISLVLAAVIVPTFVIVTFAQNKLTEPILVEEMRQTGITSGKTLGTEIMSARLLSLPNPTPAIESRMQDLLYTQPNIIRVDVIAKDQNTGMIRTVASNIEDDPHNPQPPLPMVEMVTSEFKKDDSGSGLWEIFVPIEQKSRDPRGPRRLLGTVHLVVSVRIVEGIMTALWKVTASGAALSVVALILALGISLRKTLANDRLLRQAETQNIRLTEQLHDTERQLMNTEKFAVMGQLTASFAHEIGTPLNAIGGHLQLLQDDLGNSKRSNEIERLNVINGQVSKIEQIVKNFLQSTAKPPSQKQLVDLNTLAEKTLGIVRPRMESMGVEVRRQLDRGMGPIRAVPLEVEQILLNLVNNSLDSLSSKNESKDRNKMLLEVATHVAQQEGKEWAEVSVYDTGVGIPKADLTNVLKPFFSTKRPGEGTGLGLTICQQLAHKYGGKLEIDSKEGAWTKVTLRIPYQVNV